MITNFKWPCVDKELRLFLLTFTVSWHLTTVIFGYIRHQLNRPNSVTTFLALYKRLHLFIELIYFNNRHRAKTMYQILNFEMNADDVSQKSQQTIMQQSIEYNDEREAFTKIMNADKRGETLTKYGTATLDRSHKSTIAIAPYYIPGREPTKNNKSRQSSKTSSSRKQLRRL